MEEVKYMHYVAGCICNVYVSVTLCFPEKTITCNIINIFKNLMTISSIFIEFLSKRDCHYNRCGSYCFYMLVAEVAGHL
uniref:Uncharacterized protein n=1 Tax=Octopus bimaculoides TaxID=37653 RepID=A0A0L8HPX1_OCTBM